VRPLNDTVTVAAGVPAPFTVSALIEFEEGGEAASGGLAAARTRLDAVLAKYKRLSRGVPRSAIDAALHTTGVHGVSLASPAVDVVCAVGEFPLCTDIVLGKA
jgi:phage-related baseplate assembly protein